MKNKEQVKISENYFKIAIPINQIKENIKGNIEIKNAYVKTNPIFYCKSSIKDAQSYVTYTNGYEVATTSCNLEIKANFSNLQIKKIDKENKEPISNVKFEVLDINRNKIAEIETDKDGIAVINNLNPQIVIIKEKEVADKYILSQEEMQVELEWNNTTTVTFENQRKKGNLKIEKVDADDNEIKLKDVEFELLDKNLNLIKKVTTDEKGIAYIENLNIGNYILRETKAKEDYNLSEDRKIEIKWNETIVEKIENEKKKGQIKILKLSGNDNNINGYKKGTPLEGVEFEIKDINGNVKETIVTRKDGIAISSKLESGVYIVKETKAHKDYEITEEEFLVEIQEHQEIKELVIENISKEVEEKPKLPRTGF